MATAQKQATITSAQGEFLDNPFVAAVTTLRADGSPHTTVVWVEHEDGEVSFNTAVGRAKERHLRRDPRVALTMIDPQNTYRWLSIGGRAELTEEGADAQIDRLAKKYLGKDEYPWRSAHERRIKVRITPERVEATGLDG